MRALEVCAGVGGMALGLHRAGIEHAAFCEIEPYPRRVLARHFPDVPIFEDMTTLRGSDIGPVDLVAGGIPCQPFSDAGLRKGTDDERHLWPSFRRLMAETGATFGLIENVRGLLTAQGGDAFASILSDAVEDGFHVEWQLIAAGTLGAPHIRHRVFIVLRRDGRWTWPDTAHLGLFGRKRSTPDGWPPSGRMDSTGWSETPMRWPRPAVWPWEAGMLPTPKAGDGRAKGNGGARKSPGLDQMAKGGMLPTPSASDHKGCHQHGQRRGQLGEAIGEYKTPGKLHPTNVEWMMGWPRGWTDPEGPSLADAPLQTWDAWPSDPWTTPGKPPNRRQRLKGCGNGVVAQVAELVGRDLA